MKLCIVLPTYNEASNLKELIEGIDKNLKYHNYEVLVIDDNSPDGTSQIAEGLSKTYPIKIINRKGKLGLGSAYRLGFEKVKNNFDLIISMDSDLSHNPDHLPALIKKVEDGYDISIGSRYTKGGGLTNIEGYRKVISHSANFIAKLILGIKIADCTSGYRCYKSWIFKDLDLNALRCDNYDFLEEILYKCVKKGYKIAEVPIIFKNRARGESKLNRKEVLSFIKTILRLRLNG